MAIRLRTEAGVWEFDSPTEAAVFERQRAGSTVVVPSVLVPKAEAASIVAPESRGDHRADRAAKNEDRAVPALRLMVEAGDKGIPSDTLTTKLGLTSSRGLSGVMQGVRRRVVTRANGTAYDKLVWSKGKPGKKMWFADGKRLREYGVIQ